LDRPTWLAERRRAVEADYDRDASTYDAGYDPVTPMHVRFVDSVIESVAAGGSILDAPCGTGPYFGRIRAAGLQAVGADQSSGMLAAAHAKHPGVRLEHVGPETGGYHFYPDPQQVGVWLDQAGLELVDEADEWLDCYGYHHLLLRG
jgi:SAM-dependent methyltransferase